MTEFVFVGGSGRSGTSFFTSALSRHPRIATIQKVETKLVTATGGVLDLRSVLVDTYAPGRALEALTRFDRLCTALLDGTAGRQRALRGTQSGARLSEGLAAFRQSITQDGVPMRQSTESFNTKARIAIEAIRAAALADTPAAEARTAIAMEKTPHNLLFMPFLAELEPDARFIHVMRDPRAVACSLRLMRWGPDTLEGAATWVSAYCAAWADARQAAVQYGLSLMEIFIEDIAADPVGCAGAVTGHLDIEPAPAIFSQADPEHLTRGTRNLGRADRELLDQRLGPLAFSVGYGPEIGIRHSRALHSDAVTA